MRFAEMTAPEIRAVSRDDTLVVAPIAACEQHSRHLPVFTDSILVGAVADALERNLAERVLLLPVLWLGASDHHLTFGGTLTASVTTSAVGAGAGTVTWNYAVDNNALQILGAGETAQEKFTVTISDGLAMFDRLWPASLARALRSSMVSPGLFSVGSIDLDFSNSFPISLISPGFSSRAGGVDGGGSICCGAGGSGTGCPVGDCTPSEGCGAACGQPAPGATISIDNTRPAVAIGVPSSPR